MSDLAVAIDRLKPSLLGRVLFRLLPYRKKVVMANIDKVYGDNLSPLQKKHLAQAFYSHLIRSLKENVLMRFMSQDKIKASAEVRGHEHLFKVAEQNKGIAILTGHFGNWEFSPIAGISSFEEFKGQFHFIRKTIVNKRIEKILFHRFYQAGLNVIPKQNSLDLVCDALDKNHAVVFVMDQHACISNRDGIEVEFFGEKAGTYRSLATIVRYTGVPVIPAASYRLPCGKHVLEFYEPIKWQEHTRSRDAMYYNTLAYNQALEKMILAHPEQWLWLHKRWKL